MQIYINNNLINEDYIKSITDNNILFTSGGSFKLGATPSRNISITLDFRALEDINVSTARLVDNDKEINMIIDNLAINDNNEYVISMYDKMINTSFSYDASLIFVEGKTTLGAIVEDICQKSDLILATPDFDYKDMEISFYDTRYTARDYLGFIAELNGGYAYVDNDNLYFVKFKNVEDNDKIVNIDECEDLTLGEYHKITRVVFDNGILYFPYGTDDGNTLYLNTDNPYITKSSQVESIYNSIKDFEFYSISTNNCILHNYRAGEIINYYLDDEKYPTICQYEGHNYYNAWVGGYNLTLQSNMQEETEVKGLEEKYKSLKVIQDRDSNELKILAEKTEDNSEKIGELIISDEEIKEQLKNVVNVSNTVEGVNTILLDKSYETLLHELNIRNVCMLYPSKGLFPSDTLYPRPYPYIRIQNENGTINFYKLPNAPLRVLNGVYDELNILDGKVKYTKRIGVNEDGSLYLLDEIEEYDLEDLEIMLLEGNNYLSIYGYEEAMLKATYLLQNDYTSNFATKVELGSSISLLEQEVDIKVSKKVDEEDYTGAEILLKINNDESEAKIKADKIKLEGYTTINEGFAVDEQGDVTLNNSDIISTDDYGNIMYIQNGAIRFNEITDDEYMILETGQFDMNVNNNRATMQPGFLQLSYDDGSFLVQNSSDYNIIQLTGPDDSMYITPSTIEITNVRYQNLIPISVEEQKKNFEKLDNALDIVKNTDIYKFNYTKDKDNAKKHIGFIIGKDYKYSKELTAEMDGEEVGADLYSLASVCLQAIKEQQEQIEELKKQINELKGGK